MKKRFVSILVAVMMIIPCFTFCISADGDGWSIQCGENAFMYISEDRTTMTIKGTGEMYSPEEYGLSGNPTPWYPYRTDLTQAIVEEGITSVARGTFNTCTRLEKVTLPESLERIERNSFSQCGVKEIYIGSNVNYIYYTAFYGAPYLKDVYFNGTKEEWKELGFDGAFSRAGTTVHYLKDGTSEEIPVCVHAFRSETVVPATCTEQGVANYICKNCGYTYSAPTNALNHKNKTDWVTVTEPTETEKGKDCIYCADCGIVLEERETDPVPKTEPDEPDYPDDPEPPTPPFEYPGFTDVSENSWYYNAVVFCYESGIMSGTDKDYFSPSGILTRAQFVQILAKFSGTDLAAVEYENKFNDVPKGQWYTNAVMWAVDFGVTGGVGDGLFAPNAPVTRQQLAMFLYAYSDKNGFDVEKIANLSSYDDEKNIADWAKIAMNWAVASGLISGTSPTTLSPQIEATRAQTAVIVKAFAEIIK